MRDVRVLEETRRRRRRRERRKRREIEKRRGLFRWLRFRHRLLFTDESMAVFDLVFLLSSLAEAFGFYIILY